MPDVKQTCPICNARVIKTAVCNGATPVHVALYQDKTTHHVMTKDTVARNIDTDHKSWLSAYMCIACGHTTLFADSPDAVTAGIQTNDSEHPL